ncbi:uncharacterized protein C11orf24 [Alosa sapidissima]|uniref:uncharacterized protein C11orf24 n=1 Tax=Alosa sapidissima TaxID=34773 RepID=UPI001C098B06|nr:uncharacterized protein C11orf24 [Alosa sapidissima]XP_041966797.1 uncharacterized protein C11orf24 [Alosa sapidissima]XP_041966798.1 uncharacterized protein C11orf24 [Alosa sapidissima]XP_041966799.1 uncharacterized protein C11orf24 [Alosa sapidissima]
MLLPACPACVRQTLAMTLHPLVTLSPVLGLLSLQVLSVGSTTPTIVDMRHAVADGANCTNLCNSPSCDWSLYRADQKVCLLLKCPKLEDCKHATYEDLLIQGADIKSRRELGLHSISSNPSQPLVSSTAQPVDAVPLKMMQSTLSPQGSLGLQQHEPSRNQDSLAGDNNTSSETVNSAYINKDHSNTSTSEQPRATTTSITSRPTTNEKVSIVISTTTTATTTAATTTSSQTTSSTTAPPTKSTARKANETILSSTTLSSTSKPATTTTQTSPLPTTIMTTTTPPTPPRAPSTKLPQMPSSPPPKPPVTTHMVTKAVEEKPSSKPPVTTHTVTKAVEEKPSPTTQKVFNPPTASESPVALTTSPESVTKGPVSNTSKGIVGIPMGPFSGRLVDTSSLLAVLLFGLLFFVVTVVLFLTQAYESYRRKDYTQVDYLINGMYSDSGV